MKIVGTLFVALATVQTPEKCDLPCIMDKALAGDGASAMMMVDESKKTQTPEVLETWYRIAAENGDPRGQVAYARLLIAGSRHRQDCIRAHFWLERAKSADQTATDGLTEKIAAGLADPRAYESGCKEAL